MECLNARMRVSVWVCATHHTMRIFFIALFFFGFFFIAFSFFLPTENKGRVLFQNVVRLFVRD